MECVSIDERFAGHLKVTDNYEYLKTKREWMASQLIASY